MWMSGLVQICLHPLWWNYTTKVLLSPTPKLPLDPPQRETVTKDTAHMCDVWVRDVACKKEKVAAQAILDCIEWQEWDKQASQRKEKECESWKAHQHEVQQRLAKEGAEWQEEYNRKQRASRACPDPITDPLGWCEYMWAKQDKYKAPKWAGDLWSASPMDHQQLTACMVCSWGLVRAYQQTHQNVYICPPTPHVDRYCVLKFPHSSATFNILSGFHILASPKVLQGVFGDSACPMQCSQPCPMLANRHPTGLTWFPIVLYYIK